MMKKRIIIGISGASGVIYGIRLLQVLKDDLEIETHLVLTKGGKLNITLETDFDIKSIEAMADVVHSDKNLGACLDEIALFPFAKIHDQQTLPLRKGINPALENLVAEFRTQVSDILYPGKDELTEKEWQAIAQKFAKEVEDLYAQEAN